MACFFLLAGCYLCPIGLVMLVFPGAVAAVRKLPLVHEVKQVNPLAAVSLGVMWGIVGWGLLRLRNWARWAAMMLLGIGVAWSVPALVNMGMHPGWRMRVYALQTAIRTMAALYLAQSSAVLDAFVPDRRVA